MAQLGPHPQNELTTLQLTKGQRLVLEQITECAEAVSIPVYVVGGFIRELLRGVPVDAADIDLLCEGSAEELCQALQLRLGGTVKVFGKFLTAKLLGPHVVEDVQEIDLAQARTERYPHPGSLPVVSAASLKSDLGRRDFTINSMALPIVALTMASQISAEQLRSKLIDPFGGSSDLEARLIRALHNASFDDDPTRIMRAARYCARIDGIIESSTSNWIEQSIARGCLSTLSIERMLGECVLIACEDRCEHALEVLRHFRLFEHLPLVNAGQTRQIFGQLSGALADLELVSSQEAGELLLRLSAVDEIHSQRSARFRKLGLNSDRIKGIERDVDSALLGDLRPVRTFSRMQNLIRAAASPLEEVRASARTKLGIG